ncbi:DUF2195 family protein [Alcanivorax sp.]|uniref:DUF2195 family protein n=1 Tax=Alcanivorax sp. TaxID=1872427 RepID=UPI003A946CC3
MRFFVGLMIWGVVALPAMAHSSQYQLDNGLAECVDVVDEGRQVGEHGVDTVTLRLTLKKLTAYCGCKSRIASLHWEHGDNTLSSRYFPLHAARTLSFALPKPAPESGLRLFFGCG